jgi:hypothetical protein
LEGWPVFPEIMPQTGRMSPIAATECYGEVCRTFGHCTQVFCESMLCPLIFGNFSDMRKKH